MIDIVFVSDYVCPYCLLAKEALKQAIEIGEMDVSVRFQPMVLKSKPQIRMTATPSPEVIARFEKLGKASRDLGIDMKIPPNVEPRPVTTLAFQGQLYARDHGKGDEYNDLMYTAYFVEELDIGDTTVLRALAERIGLDGADFVLALNEGVYAEEHAERVRVTKEELKVGSVPTLFINGERTQFSKYSVGEMLEVLMGHENENAGGFACGADGC